MKIRLVAAALIATILALCMPSTTLADGSTEQSTNIAEGLCVGASLDLSLATQARCARQAQASSANQQPAGTADIWSGLCVGASLNINAATSASCVRQSTTATASTTPPVTSPTPKPQPTPTAGAYVAMGDSVASGWGLPGSSSSFCGRSPQAYPNHLAASQGLPLVQLACKGATAGTISTSSSSQLKSAFATGTPALITITAGANDVGWDSFLRKCYRTTCGTTSDDRNVATLLSTLQIRIQRLLTNIDQKSAGAPPQVILTGYYDPLCPSCAQAEPRLTPDEITWLSKQTAALNQTLQTAAGQFSFARFAPIDFSGHEICSSDPWVQSLTDPAPFHPTAAGQAAIAQQIN